jgi:hypothetical protein
MQASLAIPLLHHYLFRRALRFAHCVLRLMYMYCLPAEHGTARITLIHSFREESGGQVRGHDQNS